MQARATTDGQRLARLAAQHRRLLTATARLVEHMRRVGTREYEANAADVLAVRTAVEACSRHAKNSERKST